MFAGHGLLYIHVPRTGGTFITNLFERHGLGSRQLSLEVGGHDGVREVPERTLDATLTFATLRDPWSWYASIDSHYRHQGRFDGPLQEYFGKQVSFKDVVRDLTRPGSPGSRVRLEHSARYPGARIPEVGLPGQLARSGVGLYTWLVIRMLCREPLESVDGLSSMLEGGDIPWGVNAIVDTAQLRDGVSAIIEAWNPARASDLISALHRDAPQNQSGHFRGVLPTGNPDPGVYDSEMQEWVAKADGWLFRRFGFAFPVGHPHRAAVSMV